VRTGMLLAACFTVLLMECGCREAPTVFEVSGSVTLDGQPLPDGEVLFTAADGKSSASGRIQNGRYQLTAAAGHHKVVINSSVKERNPNPQPPDAPRGDDWYYRNIIPKRYNEESTLTADLQPNNENVSDFQLVTSAK
jgi:hypothetical protein